MPISPRISRDGSWIERPVTFVNLEECVEQLTSGIIWKGSGLSDGPFIAMLTMGDLKAVWKQLKLLGNYLEIKKKKKKCNNNQWKACYIWMGKVFVTVSLSCSAWDDFRLLLFESFFFPILISVKILFEVVYFSTHRVRIEIMSIFESKGIHVLNWWRTLMVVHPYFDDLVQVINSLGWGLIKRLARII